MKILVFGASGGTGLELVEQGLEAGHDMTAFVRDPARIADIQHANLAVIKGDVLSMEDVGRAVVFLCGPAGANITGISLPVDGGLLVTGVP